MACYPQVECPDCRIHCAFVMGKARNASNKFVSIPRLELQAAVLAVRTDIQDVERGCLVNR